MKRVFAMILALAMILSMSITAFAEENENSATGSITVSNATIGKKYNIFKVFNATYSLNADGTKNVAYTVEEGTAAYTAIISEEGQKYFAYSEETGIVSKKEGANDSELIKYLVNQFFDVDNKNTDSTTDDTLILKTGLTYAHATIIPTDNNTSVVFSGLSHGYYLITSTLGTAVTINTNTPDVTVIDKNQTPGGGFKKVIIEDNVEVAHNVASIDEAVNYKISYEATNYDGDKHIQYYQIIDTVGASLNPDLSSFKVFIGDEQKTKGWLLNNSSTTDGVNEGKLGTWDGDMNTAEWYLVYLGNNQFRITIPWQDNHVIEGTTGAYIIKFHEGTTHESKYTSPTTITLTYSATVKNDAPIGGGDEAALKNTANGSWTSANETGTTPIDFVYTEVFGLGILKDDSSTGVNLAGAKFKVWKNEDCTEAVNVITNGIQGVYKLDISNNSGSNEVITPVNGKVVILGLDKGTYYLQEVEAPAGYNALTEPVELVVGEGHTPFYVFADTNGNVADLRDPDGTYLRNTYDVTHTVVHNSKGVELPSTGGTGTMLLITLGSILAMGFAVLLITQKKMSIYQD